MNRTYALLFITALLIGSVELGAMAFTQEWKKIAPRTCDEVLAQVKSIWLPEELTNISMGKRLNLHFHMINGNEIVFNGEVARGMFRDLRCGRINNFDFEITMNDSTAFELATSTRPITTAVILWKEGEIAINANGTENEKLFGIADQLASQENEPVPESIREMFGQYLNRIPESAQGELPDNNKNIPHQS